MKVRRVATGKSATAEVRISRRKCVAIKKRKMNSRKRIGNLRGTILKHAQEMKHITRIIRVRFFSSMFEHGTFRIQKRSCTFLDAIL